MVMINLYVPNKQCLKIQKQMLTEIEEKDYSNNDGIINTPILVLSKTREN